MITEQCDKHSKGLVLMEEGGRRKGKWKQGPIGTGIYMVHVEGEHVYSGPGRANI